MYEYELYNRYTYETIIKYGYNDDNVFIRNGLDVHNWAILHKDYLD